MKRRLLVSYLSLAVVVLMVLEVPLGVLSARRDREQLASAARRDAASLGVLAQEGLEHPGTQKLDELASRYRGDTGAELAVLDSSGNSVVRLNDPDAEQFAVDVRTETARALAGRAAFGSYDDEGRRMQVAAVPVRGEAGVEGAVLVVLPAAGTDRNIALTWAGLAALALVVLVVTGLVGSRLARWTTGPLAQLEVAAGAVGHGDLSARASPAGPPEVRALAVGFNDMAGRLEELVGTQQRFVADASHQLRSPLTALRLRLENLAAGDDSRVAADLAAAGDEVTRLSRIVDGLLALSRAEGRRPQREVVDVSEVVLDRQAAWSALAEERSIALRVDGTTGGGLRAWAVPGYLEQILDNLLANSLDASPGGTSISMSVADVDGKVEVRVSDEGPGMTTDEQARAFDRLWQGTHGNGGAGLGLSIVRQLARSGGGDCRLRDAAGGGLEVDVALERV